jgi:hypothetical protein
MIGNCQLLSKSHLFMNKNKTPSVKQYVALPAGPHFFSKKSEQKNSHKIMILSKNLIE